MPETEAQQTKPMRRIPSHREPLPFHRWATYALLFFCIAMLVLWAVIEEADYSPAVTHVPPAITGSPVPDETVYLPLGPVLSVAPYSPLQTPAVHRPARPPVKPSAIRSGPPTPQPVPSPSAIWETSPSSTPDPTDSG